MACRNNDTSKNVLYSMKQKQCRQLHSLSYQPRKRRFILLDGFGKAARGARLRYVTAITTTMPAIEFLTKQSAHNPLTIGQIIIRTYQMRIFRVLCDATIRKFHKNDCVDLLKTNFAIIEKHMFTMFGVVVGSDVTVDCFFTVA